MLLAVGVVVVVVIVGGCISLDHNACVLAHASRVPLTSMETPACSQLQPFSDLICCRQASSWTEREEVCLPPLAVTGITQTNADEAAR